MTQESKHGWTLLLVHYQKSFVDMGRLAIEATWSLHASAEEARAFAATQSGIAAYVIADPDLDAVESSKGNRYSNGGRCWLSIDVLAPTAKDL